MANELVPVTDEVLALARDIIEEHEPELQEASIAFLFWTEGPQKAGKAVLGQAKKVGKEYQALGFDYDFIIYLSKPMYYALDEHQRRALIHHELLHCEFVNDPNTEEQKAVIVPHDLEEFNKIINLYGFWWPMAEKTVEAVQVALPMMELKRAVGKVETLEPAMISRLRN